jgi:lipoate-protein ligase A
MNGFANMACDETILESVAVGAVPPTLRFYGWRPACLSLGYRQGSIVVDLHQLV